MGLFSTFSEQAEEKSYEIKSQFMEKVLGKEHDIVMHAIIPYDIGGSLDLYYYPDYMGGTAVASKELANYKFNKPKNDWLDAYELVMVTNNKIDLDSVKNKQAEPGSFAYDHKLINSTLNMIGRYSTQATLNPYETLEFPADMEVVGGKCFILDILSEPYMCKETKNRKFGLLLIIEIHRDEMEFAMQQKGKELIEMLKENKVYPFTGINRKSIIA
jgi:hypothetical protein